MAVLMKTFTDIMAPNLSGSTLLLTAEAEIINSKPSETRPLSACSATDKQLEKSEEQYEWKISWRNVLAFIYLHLTSVYAFVLLLSGDVKLYTVLWAILLMTSGGLGVTAGAHRLWAHRTYEAKWQLRVILVLLQTMAFQNHIYEWVRDHRVHHKFTDTNADPHNAKRGFFFSHIGWLMLRKHPDVKNKGKTIDMSDVERDPVVLWQKRTYLILMPLLCFVLPTFVPYHFWSENFWTAWYVTILRYTLSVNITWLVNSAAHIWGTKPYDKDMSSVENPTVGVVALGEGWHNYHHVFPWDYKAAELGAYKVNLTTGLIDLFAKLGWAYNLRTVSPEVIRARAQRTGDGTLKDSDDPNHHMNNVWGWGDADMDKEAFDSMTVYHTDRKNL